jgi:hypothetical protein
MQCLSLGSVGLCIAHWIRAKTVDQDEREMPSVVPCSSAYGHPRSG